MNMDIFKLLQTLTETPGPSGYETQIANVIEELWQPYVDTITRDRLGNLIAIKQGQGPEPRCRILLAAHMDEIGLMVREVVSYNGNGFLRLISAGGVDIRQLYGQLVVVHGRKNLHGVIGCLPDFMLPEERQKRSFGYDDLIVDVGLPLTDVEDLVSIGDFISFRQPLYKLLNGRVAGKALDNRASITAVTLCLEQLQKQTHEWDVVAVATVQEETRLLGAFTATYEQQPDAAIAIDVTFGKGPGANNDETHELGGGPALDLGPNVHTSMFNALKRAAERIEITVHTETHTRSSGTDAYGLQIARAGIPTAIVAIPLRYMHTMVESIATKDIKRAGRLLSEFISGLDDKFLDNLAADMMEE
ncbi:MAG: M42 family metallopeptidase [Chloroflexi bacterium]|nr:M42 family metallopeptidase [Chloroflexota bacterium]